MTVSSLVARVVLVSLFVLAAGAASAQPLTTIRWQQQPYCNVLTLNVVKSGAIYQLDGHDDQCGTATRAAVVGIAYPNPNGTVGAGLTVVTTPGGTASHIDVTLSMGTLNGSWRDSTGSTGPFVVTPGAAIPGAPRPVPRALFPAGLSAGGTTITNVAPPVNPTDAASKSYVDGAAASKANVADVRAALLEDKVWVALVRPDGSKGTTGPFTSSKLAVGQYGVVFNVAGLGLPANGIPNFVASTRCNGFTPVIATRSVSTASGSFTQFGATVIVTNVAGATADCEVFVMAKISDPDLPGSSIPPLDTVGSRSRAVCTSEGDVTTCLERP